MVKLKNICCGYGKSEIIHDVSAVFKKGKLTVILGQNGSGKTTLLKTVAGLIPPKSGEVLIDNKRISEYKKAEFAKKVAFMPQNRHIPAMRVEEYLMCARYPYCGINRTPSKVDILAVETAIQITGIEKYRDSMLKKLSGGERQKVYVAMALAQDTDLILLDEPTTHLDIARQYEILDLIRTMKEQNKTIIMVLHDIAHGLKYADDILVMENGIIAGQGAPERIYQSKILNKIYKINIHEILESSESPNYFISGR